MQNNFSLPEIRTSARGSVGNEIKSLKGYPTRRNVSLEPESKHIPGKNKNKNSVVGSIKDRIQNAIKQSQNERYNREALDDLGGMNFKIPISNVQDNKIGRLSLPEQEEDLARAEPKYKLNQKQELLHLSGDYKLKFGDLSRKPQKVLTDEERYSVDYMIVDKKQKKASGWSLK